MSKIVRFADGVMVEIAASQTPGEPVSGTGKAVERAKQAFEAAAGVAGVALKAIVGSVRTAVREVSVAQAEVEFGVGFTVEGDIYITKVKGEANINIRVTIDAHPK